MNHLEKNGSKYAAIACAATAVPVSAAVYAVMLSEGWHGETYVNAASETAKGWNYIDGQALYFDESDGRVDAGVTLDGTSAAVEAQTTTNIETYIKEKTIDAAVQTITTESEQETFSVEPEAETETVPVETAAAAETVTPEAPVEAAPVAAAAEEAAAPEASEVKDLIGNTVFETVNQPAENPALEETVDTAQTPAEEIEAPEEITPEAPAEEIGVETPAEEVTPELPAEEIIPETPAEEVTPELPAEEITPELPEETVTPEIPSAPEQEIVPEVPEESYTPQVPAAPEEVVPEIPEETVPETPEVPEESYTPEVPAAPETEYVPDYSDSTDYSDLNSAIVSSALQLVGVTDGLQCTEVVQLALAGAGVSDAQCLWPQEYQAVYGYYTDDPQPGNLIYYDQGGNGVDHIAIYIGDGMAVHGNFQTNGESHTVVASVEIAGTGVYQYIQVER